MAYGDVPPNFDGLPPEAVPWGRWITNEVQQQGKQRNRDSKRISNAINTGQGALSVTEAQGQEIVNTQDQVNNTEQQVYVQRVSDVVNVFDMTPVVERDASKFRVERLDNTGGWVAGNADWSITEWFSDGFTIQSTVAQKLRIVSNTFQTYVLGMKFGGRINVVETPDTEFVPMEIVPLMRYENGTEAHPGYGPWLSAARTGWTDTARATLILPPSNAVSNTISWAPTLEMTFTAGSSFQVRGLQVFQQVGEPPYPEWLTGPQAYLRGNLFNDQPIRNGTGAEVWGDNAGGLNDPNRVSSWSFVPGGIQVTVKAGQWIYLESPPYPVRGLARLNASFQVTQMTASGGSGTPPRVFFQGGVVRRNNPTQSIFLPQYSVGTLQSYIDTPSDATYITLAWDAHAKSDADTTFTILNPFVGDLVQQDELDPSINFGVADGSITTAKLADSAVTEPKMANNSVPNRTIVSMVATKLTGFIDAARIAANTITRTMLNADVRGRLAMAGWFDVQNTSGVDGYAQSVPTGTWTALYIPTPSGTTVTVDNTLNDGAEATISGTGVNRRLIAPISGKYMLTATVNFASSTAGSVRSMAFQVGTATDAIKKGFAWDRRIPFPNVSLYPNATAVLNVNAGDILSVVARHDTGSNLGVAIQTMQITYLGPA